MFKYYVSGFRVGEMLTLLILVGGSVKMLTHTDTQILTESHTYTNRHTDKNK